MDNVIHIPLDLPDVHVLAVSKTDAGHWLIRIESTLNSTTCHQCGREITSFHGFDQPVRVRHLPVFDTPVLIEFRPKRYQCHACKGQPTTTQRLRWHAPRSPNTKPYEAWLLRLLINSTVADVARTLNVSEASVTGVVDRWVTTSVNWDEFERLGTVGLDEIALKRGHRDYVALVTVPLEAGGVEVLAVLPDRKQETVAQFLDAIPARLKRTVERVCSDLYRGFVSAAQAKLPGAKIVLDRFHLAKAYRDCADTVRKQTLKRLKQELSKAEYAQIKGAMWPFRKSPMALKDEEWARLKRLFRYSPKLEQAYILREQLTAIFETDHTKETAQSAIRAWCERVRHSHIAAFDRFLETVETWLDEITNYFLERLSSGFVEGFNNRVKVLKRRCYGIFNVSQIFQRLTLDINGYERAEPYI
jgi:transposase